MKAQFLTLLVARVLATGLQAVVMVVVARLVGVADFGLLGAVVGVSAVAFAVATWGLPTYLPMARARGLDGEVRLGLVGAAVGLAVAGSGAAAVTAFLTNDAGTSPWLAALPVALAIDVWVEAGLTVLVADGEKARVAGSVVLRRVLTAAVFAGLVVAGLDAVTAYSLSFLVAAVVGAVEIVVRVSPRLDRGAPAPRVRELYRRMVPYLTSSLTYQARTLDVAVVGLAGGAVTAGLYSAAQRIIGPLNVVSGSAVSVLLPHAARSSLSSVRRIGVLLTAWGLALWTVPAVLGAALAEPLVELLFGADYRAAAGAFAWTVVAVPFIALASPLGSILQGQGHARFVAVNGVVWAAATLVGVFVGALLWGPSGAAAGLAVTFALKVASLLLKLMRVRPAAEPVPAAAVATA